MSSPVGFALRRDISEQIRSGLEIDSLEGLDRLLHDRFEVFFVEGFAGGQFGFVLEDLRNILWIVDVVGAAATPVRDVFHEHAIRRRRDGDGRNGDFVLQHLRRQALEVFGRRLTVGKQNDVFGFARISFSCS